jgi:hypothetical protein
MNYIDSKVQYMPNDYVVNVDKYYIVSDGVKVSLARWSNLLCDDSECGADHDEYEFKNDHFPFLEVKFFAGPLDFLPPS